MLGDVVYTNLATVTITFNSEGGAYPLNGFDDPIAQRYEPEDKMGQDGQWPTYDYDGHMEIPLEGAILADDSDDYTTKRNALTSCFRYKPTIRQRRSGVLTVQFDGVAETVRADVSISDISIPRAGASPNFSEFRIVLISDLPYWIGDISGDPYYDS